jgi:hypothetical protein
MSQISIVLIIIAVAVAYTVYSIVISLKVKDSGHCGGCGSCEVKNDFLKELEKKGINPAKKQFTSLPTDPNSNRFPEFRNL